ncbi:DUF5615 family PIN-like protein [Sinorhizobium sp. BJ1]|uniref:DUF5615 family PIN-like protein n=1 Tax=Sinorhizobium sp. BJ1 TaxID=2035455 RepID=UPI001F175532|nr:DUF5615 family PIN-like protein [Sinorhizobium sp. BJ1]
MAVAQPGSHDCSHLTWLELSSEADWDLMPRIIDSDFTFVTNNARDFRKLYAKEELHAGLVIIVPQVLPELQRELFALILEELEEPPEIVNEIIEVTLAERTARFSHATFFWKPERHGSRYFPPILDKSIRIPALPLSC